MICGDFNIDRKVENDLTRMLMGKNFKQIVQKPTTYRGNCIDHFYHNIAEHVKKVEHKLHYPCYSDHEAICVMFKDPWTKNKFHKATRGNMYSVILFSKMKVKKISICDFFIFVTMSHLLDCKMHFCHIVTIGKFHNCDNSDKSSNCLQLNYPSVLLKSKK